jgi:hypothetical protein
MPLQNRVTPFGEILPLAARGGFMGNRGILHDRRRRLGAARWRHRHWIICRLEFKDWRREVMTPNRYTELFFLDEATALAAGHRPCALCRRGAYDAFRAALDDAAGRLGADQLDRRLHQARIEQGTRDQQRLPAALDDLPPGAMIGLAGQPATAWLVQKNALRPWSPEGYGAPIDRPAGLAVTLLTPLPTVAALRGGYRPVLHASASA